MKRIFVVNIVFLFLVAILSAEDLKSVKSGNDKLLDPKETKNIGFEYTETAIAAGVETETAVKGIIRASKIRIEVEYKKDGEKSGYSETIINDGKHSYLVRPFIGKQDIDKLEREELLPSLLKSFCPVPVSGVVLSTEALDGKECEVIEYEKNSSPYYEQLWIEKATGNVLKASFIDFAEHRETWLFSEYQNIIEKVPFPMKIEVFSGDKIIKSVIFSKFTSLKDVAKDIFNPDQVVAEYKKGETISIQHLAAARDLITDETALPKALEKAYKAAETAPKETETLKILTALSIARIKKDPAMKMEMVKKAMAGLDRIFGIAPKDPVIYLLRGSVYISLGIKDKIKEEFEAAAVLDPRLAVGYLALGKNLDLAGDNKSAVEIFSKYIAVFPGQVDGYIYRARNSTRLEEFDKTIEDSSKALEINKSFSQGYYERGRAQYKKKNADAAAADFFTLSKLESSPTLSLLYYEAYNCLNMKYGKDKALDVFEKILKKDPKDANAWFEAGNIYKNSDTEKALKYFDKAIEYSGNTMAEAFYERGVIKKKNGKGDEGIADYSRAIDLKPDFKEALRSRNRAYEEKGDKDKAFEDMKRLRELNEAEAQKKANSKK